MNPHNMNPSVSFVIMTLRWSLKDVTRHGPSALSIFIANISV